MEADCVNVLVRKLSRLFETFSSSSKIIVPEEFKLFSENKFPAENVFDIYFGLTPALGINEKTPCIAFFKKKYITAIDIYPLWMEMAADIWTTTH